MKEADFIFDHTDCKYGDYWFRVIGESKTELTEKYMEQSILEVSEVVFSIQDGQFGVKRLFPFNYDVVANPDDIELQQVLQRMAFNVLREKNNNEDNGYDK